MRVPGHEEVDARGWDFVGTLMRLDVIGPSQVQGESFNHMGTSTIGLQKGRVLAYGLPYVS